jgi:hypothetical protein
MGCAQLETLKYAPRPPRLFDSTPRLTDRRRPSAATGKPPTAPAIETAEGSATQPSLVYPAWAWKDYIPAGRREAFRIFFVLV